MSEGDTITDLKLEIKGLNNSYKELLARYFDRANVKLLQYWLEDDENRKEPIFAFTEGPERLLAFHIEAMMKRREDGISFISFPTKAKCICEKCKVHFYED